MSRTPTGAADALRLLAELGASPWLVRHHELVVEAARELTAKLRRELGVTFDEAQVLVGAALHDAGKIVHPDEASRPGHQHEAAGRALLLGHGVTPQVARFCVTHAGWDDAGCVLEDLLVALADKLWKGKRDEALEARVLAAVAAATGRPAWDAFTVLDSICEAVAARGPDRLARSRV